MVESIEVSDIELHKLDFGASVAGEVDTPRGISLHYYSMGMSPDGKYIAYRVLGNVHDKIAVWDVRRREIVNMFELTFMNEKHLLGPSISKFEFLPTKNYIVVLSVLNLGRGHAVQIIDLNGEKVKEIAFITGSMHLRKENIDLLKTQKIYDFAVSPDSRKIIFYTRCVSEARRGGIENPSARDGGKALKYVTPTNYLGHIVYDLESDEIVHVLTSFKENGEEKDYRLGWRLLWPQDDGIVVTTYPPIEDEDYWVTDHVNDDYEEVFRRVPVGYATLLSPWTGEIKHRVPLVFRKYRGGAPSTGRLYTARSGGVREAYFASPDGEYVIAVGGYVSAARFSDFDASGEYVGSGGGWWTVNRYRVPVSHVGWSPDGKEVMYQYHDSFVIADYEKREVTKRLKLDAKEWYEKLKIEELHTRRIFWLHGNEVIFLLLTGRSDYMGVLRF